MRAATSMFLISLANSLPRRASMTAFLCLVVAHLEWPDMRAAASTSSSLVTVQVSRRAAHQVDEERVDPRVAGDLGVERRGEQVRPAGPRRSYPRPVRARPVADDLARPGPDLLHPRRPDEHRVERLVEAARRRGRPRRSRPGGRTRCGGRRRRARRWSPGRRRRPRSGRPAGSSRRRCRTPAARPSPPARSGSSRSKIRASFEIVVDSPPGMTSPSTCAELLRPAYGDGRRRRTLAASRGARGRRPGARGPRSVGRSAASGVTSRARRAGAAAGCPRR